MKKLHDVIKYFEDVLENNSKDYTEVREVENSEFIGDYVVARYISIPVKKDYPEDINTKDYEALFNSKKYSTVEVYCENNSVDYFFENKELYFHVLIGIDMKVATFKDARKINKTLNKLKKQLMNTYT